MNGLLGDLKFVLRQLGRSPGFVLASVLVLGLGLGANLTIFSLGNAVLLRPPPGVSLQPEHFKVLTRTEQGQDFGSSLSYPDFEDLRDAFDGKAMVAARDDMPIGLRLGQQTERRRGALVSGSYFDILGVTPALGRTLTPEDDQVVLGSPVAVISHRLWRERLGARADAVGKELAINGTSFEIVGVAAAGFKGDDLSQNVDVWVPITMQPVARPTSFDVFTERESTWMGIIGRRQPQVALTELDSIAKTLERDFSQYQPDDTRRREFTVAKGLGFDPADRRAAQALVGALLLIVSLVLVIACANVANLILARGNHRISEISLRRALGAGQRRIVRLLLTESFVVAAIAASVGLLIAASVRGALLRLLPSVVTNSGLELAIDARVIAYALTLAMASAVLFGLLPALTTSSRAPARSMGGRTPIPSKGRLRGSLVVSQLALSVVLLVSAGLLLQTMKRLQTVEPGFDSAGVLSAAVDLGLTDKDGEEIAGFYRSLLQDLRTRPQIETAALASTLPLSGSSDTFGGLLIEGNDPPAGRPGHSARVNMVTPTFFEALSIPLIVGRDFGTADAIDAERVAIVNQAFQRRYWPEQDVLGKTIRMWRGDDRIPVRVVGLAGDVHYGSLSQPPAPMMYLPLQQRPQKRTVIALRAKGATLQIAPVLKDAVARLDADLPVYAVAPLATIAEESLWQTRMVGSLISTFGLLALVLAAVGLYGVVACLVSERRKEIGIRLALGANPKAVVTGLFQRSLRLSVTALVIGFAGSLLAGRLLSGFLYGVRQPNAELLLSISAVLLAVTVIASLGPLTLAARLQPGVVLRADD